MEFRVDLGNTPLDPTEAEGLIPKLTTLSELNTIEGLNIIRARRWASSDRQELLNTAKLKMLHRKMFDQTWIWAGKYRLTQKSIGIEAFRISSEMENLVRDVKAWIEFESYDRVEVAVRFHHRLVYIHAFPNGNGRHARLATELLCGRLGVKPFTWGATLKMNEVRGKYIAALQ